jgi:prevent-host-death family protein
MTDTWTLSEAKAKLSEIVDKANREGPQTITRHGRTVARVMPAKAEGKKKPKGTLGEFLFNSPLRGSGIKIERRKDLPRKIDL